MITIEDKVNGITCHLSGVLTRIPTKIGQALIETNLGARKTEHTRSVIDFSLRIDYMSLEDYLELEKIFLVSNSDLDITDTDRGMYYSGYFIDGEMLQLEEKEDIKNNCYYYIGGIQLNKR